MSQRGLKLENISGIQIGDEFITAEQLEKDAKEWEGTAFIMSVGKHRRELPKEDLLRRIAFENMPFTLRASEPTSLEAQMEVFPYSIDGKEEFQVFACRLTPLESGIDEIAVHEDSHRNCGNITPKGATWNSGSTRLEVRFQPVGQKEVLPPLEPPKGYQKEIVLNPDDFID